ncbi:integral membrane protein [Ophiostoma piceae UAMH 11346]|uniref:Integral membrane protein n=1 Tax=Ophiostoma piceae (strain UAMH 11346) TaxID=1262450 RepID=S3CFU8_OPHP1|nr:integral membrane protein [Ophiostoma piceae UAMH 11346]
MARRRRPRRSGALTELPPLKLASQIATLQAILYAVLVPLALFTSLVSGRDFSFEQVFGWSAIRGDTTQGYLMAFIWVLAGGLFSGAAIVIIVGRTKLVLDFAATLHVLHLAVVYLYTGTVPANLAWWATMAVSTCTAFLAGSWGCQHRELRPINFGGSSISSSAAASAAAAAPSAAPTAGDEEQGFSRGRGRGRGRDGAGDYEMVPIKTGEDRRQD